MLPGEPHGPAHFMVKDSLAIPENDTLIKITPGAGPDHPND